MEKECCFPGVLRDGGDAPANLLCQLNSHVVPCASCLHRKWIENVGAGQYGILVNLVLCCLIGCSTWLSSCAANVGLRAYVSGIVTSHAMGFPQAQGKRVVPSGCLLSSHIRLTGCLTAGIWARLTALHMMSFRLLLLLQMY